MSDSGEHRDGGGADTGPKWVWVSTEESVARGTISVLACGEVAGGIWLYWWLIPWWFETNLHLLISVLVAPLLLLRSPKSVRAALAAFRGFAPREGVGFFLRSKRGAVAMLLAAGLSAVGSWGLAETWLSGHDGWSLFWRAGFIGWIGVQIGIAVAVAVAGVVTLVGPGLLMGFWLRSVIVRIGSTLRHWKEGWRRLSVNWRCLIWSHDFRRPPELLPGIDQYPRLWQFTVGNMLNLHQIAFDAERIFFMFLGPLSTPIFFLPAWLYRLSLKSTCWFWWPLVFSQTSGRTAAREVAEDGTPGADVVFAEQTEPLWAKVQFSLALALWVVAFGVPQDWLALLSLSRGGIDLLGALGDMIYLMLPCAGVQLALFLLCGRYLARAKAGHLGPWPRTAFRWLFNLRQLSLGSALVVALVLLLENWVPGFSSFAELVETHYFSRFPLLDWT